MSRRKLSVLLAAACLAPPAAAGAQVPEVSAPSAVVADAATGEVLFARAAAQRRPIASATKLMTALLVLERAALSDVVPAADYRASPVESRLNLRSGERMTVADLLRGLLLESANDAAVTLAEHVSGSRQAFVGLMNRRAAELGLTGTRFANPIGLDAPGNHSTARDLVALTRELRGHAFFRQVTDRSGATLQSGARRRTIQNRNLLVRLHPFMNGVKTGRTNQAGYVLVGSGSRGGITLVTVVLGTASEEARDADTLELMEYGFRRYRRAKPVSRGEIVARVPVRYRPGAALGLMSGRDIVRRVRKGVEPRVELVDVPQEVEGPVRRGQRLGTAEVYAGDRRISRLALFASADVPEAGLGRRMQDWVTRPGTLLVLAGAGALMALAGLAVRRGNRPPPRRRRTEEPSTP